MQEKHDHDRKAVVLTRRLPIIGGAISTLIASRVARLVIKMQVDALADIRDLRRIRPIVELFHGFGIARSGNEGRARSLPLALSKEGKPMKPLMPAALLIALSAGENSGRF
jgi:hypothetical protein